MARVTVGKCGFCGKELRVAKEAIKPIMHLTCKCGWSGYVGEDKERCTKLNILRKLPGLAIKVDYIDKEQRRTWTVSHTERIREILESLALVQDEEFVLDTGNPPDIDGVSGKVFRACEGRVYSSEEIVSMILRFLERGPKQRRTRGSNYGIGLVVQGDTHGINPKWPEPREGPHLITYWDAPKGIPLRLVVDAIIEHYDCSHGDLGCITVIRTGDYTFKGCFHKYCSIEDLGEAYSRNFD